LKKNISKDLLILSGLVSNNFNEIKNDVILKDIFSKVDMNSLPTYSTTETSGNSGPVGSLQSKKSLINSFLNDDIITNLEKDKPNLIIIKNTLSTLDTEPNDKNKIDQITNIQNTFLVQNFDNYYFKNLFKNLKNSIGSRNFDILEILLNVSIFTYDVNLFIFKASFD